MNRLLMHVLMAQAGAVVAGGAGDRQVAARKENEPGLLTNKEQERQDDRVKAEEQVEMISPKGRRITAARNLVDEMKALGFKVRAAGETDTAPGKMPPLPPDAVKFDEGVATGDERNTKAPEHRLEVSDPDAARRLDEKRQAEAERAQREATKPRGEVATGATAEGSMGANTTRASRGAPTPTAEPKNGAE